MNFQELFSGTGQASLGAFEVVRGLGMAFALGQVAAWLYAYTHSGLSYSKGFVQSIILLCVIVSLSMMVIGSNLIVAFGLIGALSVIRFRNILKDTRDTAFIFFALVVGMATGTESYRLAIVGSCVYFCLLLYLYWSDFGSRYTDDGFLRFDVETSLLSRSDLEGIFSRHCRSTRLLSQRFDETERGELAYRLTMRDPDRSQEMIIELSQVSGVGHVTFVLQEEEAEV